MGTRRSAVVLVGLGVFLGATLRADPAGAAVPYQKIRTLIKQAKQKLQSARTSPSAGLHEIARDIEQGKNTYSGIISTLKDGRKLEIYGAGKGSYRVSLVGQEGSRFSFTMTNGKLANYSKQLKGKNAWFFAFNRVDGPGKVTRFVQTRTDEGQWHDLPAK